MTTKKQAPQKAQDPVSLLAVKPGDTYPLKKPITIGLGENKLLISEVTITDDPVAEHIMAMDMAEGNITATMHFLAAITNQPFEAIKKMSAPDLIALRPTVTYLMGEFGLLGM